MAANGVLFLFIVIVAECTSIQVMATEINKETIGETSKQIQEALQEIKKAATGLLDKPAIGNKDVTIFGQIVDGYLLRVLPLLRNFELGSVPLVGVDSDYVAKVLQNLVTKVRNALKAIDEAAQRVSTLSASEAFVRDKRLKAVERLNEVSQMIDGKIEDDNIDNDAIKKCLMEQRDEIGRAKDLTVENFEDCTEQKERELIESMKKSEGDIETVLEQIADVLVIVENCRDMLWTGITHVTDFTRCANTVANSFIDLMRTSDDHDPRLPSQEKLKDELGECFESVINAADNSAFDIEKESEQCLGPPA